MKILLELMRENNFDALLTFDKNIAYQQNFSNYNIAVVIIYAPDNSYSTLKELVKKIKGSLVKGLKKGVNEIKD